MSTSPRSPFQGVRLKKAVLAAAEGRFDLIISRPISLEVLEVLARKLVRDAEELARVALFLADLGRVVRARRKVRMLRYDPDNRILECGFAGGTAVIVTGDRMMLKLGVCEGVRVVTLREFLRLVEG